MQMDMGDSLRQRLERQGLSEDYFSGLKNYIETMDVCEPGSILYTEDDIDYAIINVGKSERFLDHISAYCIIDRHADIILAMDEIDIEDETNNETYSEAEQKVVYHFFQIFAALSFQLQCKGARILSGDGTCLEKAPTLCQNIISRGWRGRRTRR